MPTLDSSDPGGFARLNRRNFLRAGLWGTGGIGLADLLRLRTAAADGHSAPDTAVIYLLQSGGPTQFETYDPKPLAPQEIRGDFAAIETSVPGVQFSELMAQQAQIMDKLTVLRSIHHPSTQHSSSMHLLQTGYYCRPESEVNETPSVGSCAARMRGANRPGMPPYAAILNEFRYGNSMWLGKGYDPFRVETEPNDDKFAVPNLTLLDGLTVDRIADRRGLLSGFDRARRIVDLRGSAAALDQFSAQALEMVTGDAARRAFNIQAEKPEVRERYGRNLLGQRMLLARRLVEYGVTFVTVGTIGWDHHGDLWNDMRRFVPAFDQAVTALVEDLHERGLAERVLVVAMGEFGRTPRISTINGLPPGRDHWGDVSSVLMAGGGRRGGQIVGASDQHGAFPTAAPYRMECVLAHMYRHLGIDPETTFPDFSGRPRSLLEIRDRITELS